MRPSRSPAIVATTVLEQFVAAITDLLRTGLERQAGNFVRQEPPPGNGFDSGATVRVIGVYLHAAESA